MVRFQLPCPVVQTVDALHACRIRSARGSFAAGFTCPVITVASTARQRRVELLNQCFTPDALLRLLSPGQAGLHQLNQRPGASAAAGRAVPASRRPGPASCPPAASGRRSRPWHRRHRPARDALPAATGARHTGANDCRAGLAIEPIPPAGPGVPASRSALHGRASQAVIQHPQQHRTFGRLGQVLDGLQEQMSRLQIAMDQRWPGVHVPRRPPGPARA